VLWHPFIKYIPRHCLFVINLTSKTALLLPMRSPSSISGGTDSKLHTCLAGFGGSYFSPPWIWLLALQSDNAGMREPSNSLARDEIAWSHLYKRTLQIVNQKLEEKGLGQIKPVE
jgi:hypothetical protein